MIIPVICVSQIAENDPENQIRSASSSFSPFRSSSFIRSKIKIFASIAIPIESTSPAIEASVRTTQNCFKIARVATTYMSSARAATNHEAL